MGHHFVPRFLLNRWADNNSNCMVHSFWWEEYPQKVLQDRISTKTACQEEDLNAFHGVPPSQRNAPEDDFFTPRIDTPASKVLRHMLSEGIETLSFEQRERWARFLVALGVRTPEALREKGYSYTRKALGNAKEKANGPPDMEAHVSQIIEQNMASLQKNMPIQTAMALASDQEIIPSVMAMTWWLRKFDRDDILIGDRPLLATPRTTLPCGIPLKAPNCMIVLPISPNTLFFASCNPRNISSHRKKSEGRLVCIINEETVTCARKYVFCQNLKSKNRIFALIEKKMHVACPPL